MANALNYVMPLISLPLEEVKCTIVGSVICMAS